MNAPTFCSPYFALLETYAPQLLAGPEGRIQHTRPPLAASQIGIFGALGQSDWYVDTDYASIRAGVRRALADPSVRTIDLLIDSPGGSVIGLPETADAIFQANKVKPVNARVVELRLARLIGWRVKRAQFSSPRVVKWAAWVS